MNDTDIQDLLDMQVSTEQIKMHLAFQSMLEDHIYYHEEDGQVLEVE